MEAYTSFAKVYDKFMDNVPYEEWCSHLCGMLREDGIENGLILDLGCGTGSLTELLAGEGYDCIGVDLSADMLEIAMENGSRAVTPFCIFSRICGNLSSMAPCGQ